jgi:DUF4097 and DUF4098 domain-containing protein YvlB
MRRVSYIGPILLIFIGAIFLLHNVYPDLPLADWFAQFWPFLLIGWGVLRLIEILTWAVLRKPLPSNGITGGEWALIVLLFVIGSGVSAVHARGWWSGPNFHFGDFDMFGEAFDYPLAGQVDEAGKTPKIVIENFRGNARIVGSDTTAVKVTGRKTVRALKQADADQGNLQTPFEVVKNGSDIIIRTNQDRASDRQRIGADLEITVPKGSSVEARGRYGDFEITDITGDVDIASDNAGVRLQNIGGNVRVDTRKSDIVRAVDIKGQIELKGRGNDLELQDIAGPVTVSATYTGTVQMRNMAKPVHYEAPQTELSFEKLPGQIQMTVGELSVTNVVGPIHLSARAKDVQLNDYSQGVEISVDRGDITLRPNAPPLGQMDIRTRSGDIDFAVPDKARLDLSASTDHGEINNDFGSEFKGDASGRGATLKGAIGQGPRIVLTTNRGSITVRKANGSETTQVIRGKSEDGDEDAPEPPAPAKPPKAPLPPAQEQ